MGRLAGTDWRVRQAGESTAMLAGKPGCVHKDLLRNGTIPDPHFRDRER